MKQRVDTLQQQLAQAKEAADKEQKTGQIDCKSSVLVSVQAVWEVDHLQLHPRGLMELLYKQTPS
eukprot:7282372-Prorocentrum_lima.AAC.1